MIAKSRYILVKIINDWRRDHPKQKVPGWLGDGKNVGPRMLNFARVSTEVLHDTLEIYPMHFVRIAQGFDGSCMLLFAHAKNTCAWLGYHAWLGGDLGATEYTILHTCDRKEYEKNLADRKRLEKKRVELKRLERKVKAKAPTPYINLNSSSSSNESSDEPSKHNGPSSLKRGFQQARRKCFSIPLSVKKPEFKHNSQSTINPPRTPPRLNSPFAWPPTPSTPSNKSNVLARFQFLTGHEYLGAIPRSVDLSLTSSAFFEEAFTAYTIVGKAPAVLQMAGVKIVIKSSAERPVFVPWGNKECFHEMMEIVKEKAIGEPGMLQVEVTCVPKDT